MHNTYDSPLCTRYAGRAMQQIFSDDNKFTTWRKLWIALAESEQELGLPITDAQIEQLKAHVSDIDYEFAAAREHEVRHDVMAHVLTYGECCPDAKPILHLGATSCYVGDNTDVILMREALQQVRRMLVNVLAALADFAETHKAQPTLAYTHFQAAQPTTIGKRATLWMQDILMDLEQLEFQLDHLKLLGCKGTTGTGASFLTLFDGDEEKVVQLEEKICKKMGFDSAYAVSGQTYSRKVDFQVLQVLCGVAQSAAKFSNDIRLLQHDRQVEEPFEKNQIGSSAMAYKRNPMRSERICSLSRYLMADAMNAPMTASTQWLERTLDDSANRRISLPEGFLCADAVLRLAQNVTNGLHVNDKIVEKTVREYLPFIATENLMMEGVKRGGDRQQLHEIIRSCSMDATAKMKAGESWDLLADLSRHSEFGMSKTEMEAVMDPSLYTGRCAEQVAAFLSQVRPLIADVGQAEAEINL